MKMNVLNMELKHSESGFPYIVVLFGEQGNNPLEMLQSVNVTLNIVAPYAVGSNIDDEEERNEALEEWLTENVLNNPKVRETPVDIDAFEVSCEPYLRNVSKDTTRFEFEKDEKTGKYKSYTTMRLYNFSVVSPDGEITPRGGMERLVNRANDRVNTSNVVVSIDRAKNLIKLQKELDERAKENEKKATTATQSTGLDELEII